MAENSYNHKAYAPTPERAAFLDAHTAKKNDASSFVPPSMEMVTGKSVMEEEPLCPPLVPSATRTPETVENSYYLAGYLKNYLGKRITAQFLIGTSGTLVDRSGVLMDVGASFIVLQPISSDDMLMCDLNSIRFVTIYR